MQVPAWDAINSEWVPTQLALNDLSDVNADVTDPTSNGAVFQWDLATQQWVAANSLTLRLEDLGDTGPLSGATEGQVPSWDAAASEWKPLSVINPIPYFTGKYGVGSGGGTSWVPWANPKEGDIFVNKSTEPPHFEVYENGAWKIWNFATATRALGLLGDLANVDLGSKAPGNGDALIWSVKTQQWVSGNTPAHIAQYTASSVYSEGTTVYYKGGIFKATRTILANESPEFLTGDGYSALRRLQMPLCLLPSLLLPTAGPTVSATRMIKIGACGNGYWLILNSLSMVGYARMVLIPSGPYGVVTSSQLKTRAPLFFGL